MRTMIDLGGSGQRGLHVISTPTSVDCGRPIKWHRRRGSSLRSLVECMVPTCCVTFPSSSSPDHALYSDTDSLAATSSTTVTVTFFGHRKSRVSFCIQEDPKSDPLLLLEFAVPTSHLAREMQHGHLRIALECDRLNTTGQQQHCCSSLYEVPVWCMYCNGRKVGFAVRRHVAPSDAAVLRLMQSVSIGAGVLPVAEDDMEDLMYLRASFDRVVGSADSESFHMINPVGSAGQELSVFLLRS